MYIYYIKVLFTIFFFTGCSVSYATISKENRQNLSYLLQSLDTKIDKRDADKLSLDIYTKVEALTKKFQLTAPPLFHNILVNSGIRKYGLCYHWSDALFLHLVKQKYRIFEFHFAVSDMGSYLYEHNALVVTVKGKEFEESILLDAWRNSGELYYAKVKYDSKYNWEHRINRCSSLYKSNHLKSPL